MPVPPPIEGFEGLGYYALQIAGSALVVSAVLAVAYVVGKGCDGLIETIESMYLRHKHAQLMKD